MNELCRFPVLSTLCKSSFGALTCKVQTVNRQSGFITVETTDYEIVCSLLFAISRTHISNYFIKRKTDEVLVIEVMFKTSYRTGPASRLKTCYETTM